MEYIGRTELWDNSYLYIKDEQQLKLYKMDNIDKNILNKDLDIVLGEVEPAFIKGTDHLGMGVIFYVENFPKDQSDHNKNEYSFKISEYITLSNMYSKINSISFFGPEIDCIYPIYSALSNTDRSNGAISFKLKEFSTLKTKSSCFKVDNQKIKVHFGITVWETRRNNKQPVEITSYLIFFFKETEDYGYIQKLCQIGKEFIQFLCYRQNIQFDEILLRESSDNPNVVKRGKFYFEDDNLCIEEKPLKDGRNIPLKAIEGKEGDILQLIADNRLYTNHIPRSYSDSKIITIASFILITSAFEWTYQQIYSKNYQQSLERRRVEDEVIGELTQLKNKASGKAKKFYQQCIRVIKNNKNQSLEDKIIYAFTENLDVLSKYIQSMYPDKENSKIIKSIGKEVATQRNNYAHGNIDKDFKIEALIGIVLLKYLVYCMQLRSCGLTNSQINQAISQLFRIRIIEPYEFRDTQIIGDSSSKT